MAASIYTSGDRELLIRWIKNLDRAIGSGVLTIDYPERGRVTYRTLAELIEARKLVYAQLTVLDGTVTTARRVVVVTSSGF